MLAKRRRGPTVSVASPQLFCVGWMPTEFGNGRKPLDILTFLHGHHFFQRWSLGFCFGGYYPRPDLSPEGLGPLAKMILPYPRGNGTGPGGNMCLDDKLHESKGLVKMTNIILEHILSPEEEGSRFCFVFSFESGQKSFRDGVGHCSLTWLIFKG